MWRWGLQTVQEAGMFARHAVQLQTYALSIRSRLDSFTSRAIIKRNAYYWTRCDASFTPRTASTHAVIGDQISAGVAEREPEPQCIHRHHRDGAVDLTDIPSTRLIESDVLSASALSAPAAAVDCSEAPRVDPHSQLHCLHTDLGHSQVQAHDNSRPSSEPSSADQLRRLLSAGEHGPSLHKFSFNYIRNHYHKTKVLDQLPSLDTADFSALISLLGSLSVSTPQSPYCSVFSHPAISHMLDSAFRPHWALIRSIATDKCELEGGLRDSDYYWLLRALCFEFRGLQGKTLSPHVIKRTRVIIKLARQYYSHLEYHSDVAAHIPFLEILLSSWKRGHVEESLRRIHDLVSQRGLRPELLWLMVLHADVNLMSALKELVLSALQPRLLTVDSEQLPTLRIRTFMDEPDAPSIKSLVTYLQDALFSRMLPSSLEDTSHSVLSQWAFLTTHSIFALNGANETHSQWNALVLLAIACNPSSYRRGASPASAHSGTFGMAFADWYTICALASLEQSFLPNLATITAPIHDGAREKLKDILEALWSRWSSQIDKDRRHPFALVARVVCASFLRLAGRLRCHDLVESCKRFCAYHELGSAKGTAEGFLGMSSLAEELLTSALLCGSSVEAAVASTLQRVSDAGSLSNAFGSVISSWAQVDVGTARELLFIARRSGVAVNSDVVTDVAVAVASHGRIRTALEYLEDTRLTSQQHLAVLRRIIDVLLQEGHRFRVAHFVPAVGGAMLKLFSFIPPPRTWHLRLQSTLLLMPRFSQASAAVAIVRVVTKAHPAYFQAPFYMKLIQRLLRHRQFRLAERIYRLSVALWPNDKTLSLQSFILELARRDVSSIAYKLALPFRRTALRPDDIRLARMLRFREVTPARPLTLKIRHFLTRRRRVHPDARRDAMHVLIRAGRLRASKQLFDRLREQQSPGERTLIGNHILHASLSHPSRQSLRRVRKTLNTLNELIKTHGFVPDRVTLNILLKSLILWVSMVNSEKLREIFDHVVRNGYPTGGVKLRYAVPFGTSSQPSPLISVPHVDPGLPLYFPRHVRPLYKMFIRGFYARGDIDAAHTVIGILKAVETEFVDALGRQKKV
ncbi:uncharacterized protein LAESUDRAFT_405285 [Laetiporus sulphureus 93-53]|uniref:Uncharacterized protein n=1 Tax=Laetiporus sulphureus 93-53 TaxID=1314785 RepID=A0A165CD95_9APHY|nr:uncharacterized protein LAESUDRAFT_405285 [Laetiporus sulphureus 93-53]KZT02604.1 hypothetical protein LAESUDRAFT_405285 [Laetiporus sulphureus 93-53]